MCCLIYHHYFIAQTSNFLGDSTIKPPLHALKKFPQFSVHSTPPPPVPYFHVRCHIPVRYLAASARTETGTAIEPAPKTGCSMTRISRPRPEMVISRTSASNYRLTVLK